MGNSNNKSVNHSNKGLRLHSVGQNTSSLSHQSSVSALSNFCAVNELEKSMSYIERTAKKLLPILTEVKRRMIPDKKKKKAKDVTSKRRNGSKV